MAVHSRQVLLLGGALAALTLLMAALYSGAAELLRDSRQSSYRSLLDAQVARLQQWIDERRADVEQLAADPYIRELSAGLARAGKEACTRQEQHLADLQTVLTARFGKRAPSYVHLLNAEGRVMISTLTNRCGTLLPEEVRNRLVQARQRGSAFIRPLDGTDGHGTPLVWYESPVQGLAESPTAYVGYGVPAREAFGFLDEHGRFGDSGEIYVVDHLGQPISARRGPVPNGGNSAPATSTPLLAELQAARTAGADRGESFGMVMMPYVGPSGRETVGVWRWLPRRGIGLVLEVDAAEAFGPLRYLRWIAWQSGMLAALALGIGLVMRRLEGQAGQLIGQYRILGSLGEGAVSNVYLAEHILMRRQVALKVLKPQAATDEWQARFRREAWLAGKLHHQNFVRLYDYGWTRGAFYYAMEYLKGCNFAELVEREGPQPATRVIQLLRQVCAALEESHGLGILHRDIKPQNIMVCDMAGQHDLVKVLDFGLVKKMGGDHSRDLTVGLRILGTPAYLSPERITDPGSTDPRSDLYAVGAVGFFLLTGRKPFESESDLQLTHRILHEPVPRVSKYSPAAPPDLVELVARCLDKDPEKRPASARALKDELSALLAQMH
jgi:eukaryotic-like serine/threonine-protein kinase